MWSKHVVYMQNTLFTAHRSEHTIPTARHGGGIVRKETEKLITEYVKLDARARMAKSKSTPKFNCESVAKLEN